MFPSFSPMTTRLETLPTVPSLTCNQKILMQSHNQRLKRKENIHLKKKIKSHKPTISGLPFS